MKYAKPSESWRYAVACTALILGFIYIVLDVMGVFHKFSDVLQARISPQLLLTNLAITPMSAAVAMVRFTVPPLLRVGAYALFLLSFAVLPLSLARFPILTWAVSAFLWFEILWLVPRFNASRSPRVR